MSITARRLLRRKIVASEQSDAILWGSYIQGSTYGPTYSNAPWDNATWDVFESHAGKAVSVMHYGLYPWWVEPFPWDVADKCSLRGAYPCIDMMLDDNTSLADVASGMHDTSWIAWVTSVKNWGKPMFFRWCGEMNGDWRNYGNEEIASPGAFVAAWRHIKDIADGIGATNITWVWCPNVEYGGQIPFQQIYPGDEYVDWTGLDGYNWGTASGIATEWLSWHEVFKNSYDEVLRLAPTKPMMIAETACNEAGGSKADWITDALLTQLPTHFPQMKALLWFNWFIFEHAVTQQWPIESSPEAQSAFAAAINSDYYQAGSLDLPNINVAVPAKIVAL